jgi:hypothetical protein
MYGLKIAAAGLVALAFAAAPAGATGIPTTGAQITLGNCVASPCESTYPAGEPFFVRHGFVEETRATLVDPATRFELTLDGEQVPAALQLDVVGSETSKLYVSDFRFGLTGVHTLVGCWYGRGVLLFCGTRTITFTG